VELGTVGARGTGHAPSTAVASGAQILLGIGAIVLGIVALAGFAPASVSLVALLVLGAGVLFSGIAVSGRLAAVVRRG
jgi:hypothetical protein